VATGSSVSTAKNLPLKWSPKTANRAWARAAARLRPVVARCPGATCAFVTAIDGDEKEKLFVACVDVKTGKVAWKKEFAACQKGKNNPMMSRACADAGRRQGSRLTPSSSPATWSTPTHAGDVKVGAVADEGLRQVRERRRHRQFPCADREGRRRS
jgi:hypothetical protein